MDQNGSNLIKLEFFPIKNSLRNVDIKSCHIYHEDKNGHSISNQIGSDPSKMAQT